jgi:uncharacterized protein (TIGR03790 family)
MRRLTLSSFTLLVLPLVASAIEPADVFILANKTMPDSLEVARHYVTKRGVHADHILTLDLPTGEDIARADYNARLKAPLRAALQDRKDKVKVLLTVYGVPLRVGGQPPNDEESKQLAELRPELAKLRAELKIAQDHLKDLDAKAKDAADSAAAKHAAEQRAAIKKLSQRVDELQAKERRLAHAESQAAVDSELSLLWWDDYELVRWQDNLLNFQVAESARNAKPPILMVARLDGPTPERAKRLVDQAVEVEKTGLTGKVYVDARGIKYDPKSDPGFGYGGYDEALREMATLLEKEAKLPVILDDKPELFASGACPDCALYCGWYSLANYVDCCRFVPGAVAYHIASAEAVSVRDPKAKYWCKNLLEAGAIATLGPVAEPYTIGFPKPAEFFGLLVTGEFTLVECYYRTLYLNSWMTVLIGDPLYRPFAKEPRLRSDQVKPSPQGGKPFHAGTP